MNDEDRKLLELAAKAAGIVGVYQSYENYDYERFGAYDGTGLYCEDCNVWNPLTNDGDALRLAVKLSITLFPNESDKAVASIDDDDGTWIVEDNNNDEYAAMRRAIVRAAAEVGKRMA